MANVPPRPTGGPSNRRSLLQLWHVLLEEHVRDELAAGGDADLLEDPFRWSCTVHADRVARRLKALGEGSNPLMAVVGAVETAFGQVLALGKTPFDLLRGSGGEEKVLKNAKDACATEALEIATYTALARLARSVGDDETAKLVASILTDEERMLQRVLREIPKLTDAVVGADIKGEPSYDIATTGAAEVTKDAVRTTATTAKRAAHAARQRAVAGL